MRYTQPQSGPLQIDQSPLGAMLRASVVGSMGIEPVSRKSLGLASSVTRVVNRHGVGFQHAVSNGGVSFGPTGGMGTLIAPGNPISVFIRAFVSVTGVRQVLLADWDAAGTNNSFCIELTAANQYRAITNSGTTDFPIAGGTVTTGWHDILAVYLPTSSISIYADGTLLGTAAAPPILAVGSGLRLGAAGLYNLIGFQGQISVCHIFQGDVSAQRASLSDNPWQIFKSPQRVLRVSAGGAATYSYTASGGFTLSGTAPTVRSITRTATGGATFSGSATQSRGAVKSATGGILFAGTAALARGKAYTASGGLTLSGAATVLRGVVRSAAGGLQLAGAATVSFFSAVQSRVVSPIGGLLLRGAAAARRSLRKVAAGGISFGGSSATVATVAVPTVAAFGQSTLMRATVMNRSVQARAISIAMSGTMRGSFSQSTIMKPSPQNGHTSMSNPAINRTANLL